MNDAIRKFAQEVKEKIVAAFQTAEFQKFISDTKAAADADSGTFKVVISTADVDRQGESIDQAGCDDRNYMKNPVVLWGHDYYSLPIGICEKTYVEDGKRIAEGRFAPEAANPFAQQVRRLYDAGIVRATSVGLIVQQMEGNTITKWELLEFSFVPVPANPYALTLSKAAELKLDLAMIATKGLKLETKEEAKAPAMGEECDMGDGEMGTMQDDGNGGMVCKPKAAKTPEEIAAEENAKTIAAYYEKAERKEKDAQQIGAILAELQNILADAIVRASKLILDIVQRYGQTAAGKAEIAATLKNASAMEAIKTQLADLEKTLKASAGEERPEGDAPKQRSQAAEGATDLEDFLTSRQLLQSAVKSANAALESMNKRLPLVKAASRK